MNLILLIINLIFYLAFPILDGPVWCKDSLSYTSMQYSREPLYPLFLKFFRDILGEEKHLYDLPVYLTGAVIAQSILTAFVTWYVVRTLSRFGKNGKIQALLMVLVNLSLWMPSLLNRFAALRASTYFESVMTESLGIPLYLLFILQVFLYITKHAKRNLVCAGILMLLCISLRKQLMVTMIIFLCGGFLVELLIRKNWKRFLLIVMTCILAYVGADLFDHAYNFAIHDTWHAHTGNAMGIDCVLLYTAEESDRALFADDPDTQAVFDAIMEQMAEQELRYVDLPTEHHWTELTEHFALSYDVIGYDIMNPIVDAWVEEHYPDAYDMEFSIRGDEIEGKLRDGLMKQDKAELAAVWYANMKEALGNTALRYNSGLDLIILAAYAGLIAMMILLALRAKTKENYEAPLLGLLTLGAILVNCGVVSALIFPQTRYMIYNMGLFYAVICVLAVELIQSGKDTHIKTQA